MDENLKLKADWELDDPDRAPEFKQPFRRDQNLKPTFTDAMLFKQKVLAVLAHEIEQWTALAAKAPSVDVPLYEFAARTVKTCESRVEGIQP